MPEKRLEEVEPGAVTSLRDLIKNLDRLEKDYRDSVEKYQRFQRWVFAVGLAVLIGFGTLTYTALSVRSLVNYVAECNTAGSKCAKDRDKNTGAAVGVINDNVFKASIYFGECARRYPELTGKEYELKLRACVAAKRKEGR